MGSYQALRRKFINFDYKLIIPFLSLFPDNIAFKFFKLRGLVQYYTNIEWKGISLNQPFMRQETINAIKLIKSELDFENVKKLTKLRFINESYDEYLSYLYSKKKIYKILENLEVENLDELLEIKAKQGIVFISTHFDAFTLGLMGLGYKGLNMNVINTRGITDDKIPYAVREYYRKKYLAMEKIMNGEMPFIEDDKNFFIERLKHNDSVGLMGDIPGTKSTVFYDFFGKNFKMPLGAWKFALETESMLSGFVCIRLKKHKYKIFTIKPYLPSQDPYESLKPIYDFLKEYIKNHPEKWLASYLLNNY